MKVVAGVGSRETPEPVLMNMYYPEYATAPLVIAWLRLLFRQEMR